MKSRLLSQAQCGKICSEVTTVDIKRRKELLSAYKNRHPEMGVISFQCRTTGEAFLTIASDTTARLNRVCFQLSAGQCPNKRLQELWTRYGEDDFEFGVVKTLEYDDPMEDHTEELETLCELCLIENPQAQRI